jgi:hypothetical protein
MFWTLTKYYYCALFIKGRDFRQTSVKSEGPQQTAGRIEVPFDRDPRRSAPARALKTLSQIQKRRVADSRDHRRLCQGSRY